MTGDRTTLNVATDEHRATREVKDEYQDSWTDVLRFYREHRPGVSVVPMQNQSVDSDEIAREVWKRADYAELGEQVATRVTEELQR